MAPKMPLAQLISLEPESIHFDMAEKEPTMYLTVKNTSEKMVAFKVKTTHPKRYLVRPNQDVIPVGGSSRVKICLHVKDAKQVRQERIAGRTSLDKDFQDNKFLVQSVVVKHYLHEIEELQLANNAAATKEMGNFLKKMWIETTKDDLVNRKLHCVFDYPEDMNKLMEANSIAHMDIPTALEVPLPGHGGANDAASPADGTAAGSVDESLANERKKYQELINFTVQLTAERDRFKNALKEANKNIELLKKEQHAGTSTARAVRTMDESSAVAAAGAAETSLGGFSLWQIMLVAVISFLVGRLIL